MIPIINAGFEDPVLNDNAFTSNSIPGWEGTDLAAPNNFGVFNPAPTFFPNEAPEGSNVAYIERGAVFQTLSEVLTANTMYTLEVLVGDSLIDPLPGFAVQLMAGGTVLAEATSPSPTRGRLHPRKPRLYGLVE